MSKKAKRKKKERICITCEYCGEVFEALPCHKDKRFCNMKCFNAYKKSQRIEKKCIVCGKTFIVPPSLDTHKCCSNECRHKYQSQLMDKGIIKQCLYCDKDFKVPPHEEETAKFCSWKCFSKYRINNKLSKEERKARRSQRERKQVKKDQICIQCGGPLKTRNQTLYCSVECMKEAYKTRMRGKNNPNWKGGEFTRINSRIPAYVRQEVLERDSHTCQFCGYAPSDPENYKYLHCHHIEEYANGGDATTDNLITLCLICHWVGEHGWNLTKTLRETASQAGITIKPEMVR